jgi:hypothetical protein
MLLLLCLIEPRQQVGHLAVHGCLQLTASSLGSPVGGKPATFQNIHFVVSSLINLVDIHGRSSIANARAIRPPAQVRNMAASANQRKQALTRLLWQLLIWEQPGTV